MPSPKNLTNGDCIHCGAPGYHSNFKVCMEVWRDIALHLAKKSDNYEKVLIELATLFRGNPFAYSYHFEILEKAEKALKQSYEYPQQI